MGRTPAQGVIDQVVARALVPMLREGGYHKDKRTFRRVAADCAQVVNVQASQWGSRSRQKFTVNLGVFFPKVQERLAGYLPMRISQAGPTESQCQVRQRLGMLMSEQRDLWWDVEVGQDASAVSAELGAAVRAHGLPWLEDMADVERARRAAEAVSQTFALGFDLAIGELERAQMRFRALLSGNADPDKLRSWGRAHGLLE